jgi:transcriptional regulator with XRE-family HTH domain
MVNINKIKDTCKTKGIKQGYLCAQLGVAKGYFNDVERGKNSMSDERIAKIAEILNVSIAYLTDQTDDPSPVPGEPIPKSDLEKLQDMTIDMVRQLDDLQKLKMVHAALAALQKPKE